MCAVASAADSVIVMMKPVAANPSRHNTSALPRQRGSSFSRIGDAPLPVRAELRDAAVHRQRAEEREQHEDERGERREEAGGEKRDPGLVAERREVIDPGQAHHLPPGGLVGLGLALGRADALEKPGGTGPAAAPEDLVAWVRFRRVRPPASSSSSVASLNSPSHFATTTVARQLPMTLVIVRAMSISSSTPRMSVMPSSGRPYDRERAGEDDERRARHAGDALARQHQRQQHRDLLADRQLDARRLRHEHGGERQVERRAVEVEAVAERQHERHDAPGHAEPLEHLHRARQRRLARRGRERDDRRLLHRADELAERHLEHQRDRQEHEEDQERPARAYSVSTSLARLMRTPRPPCPTV